jgi:CheY-like chemotaxis protein
MSNGKRRILVIDDSDAIHQDFRRLLSPERSESRGGLAMLEGALFGTAPARPEPPAPAFEVESAFQGRDGVAMVRKALEENRPYALVFLDYRMPPGWNGVETLRHLWKVAPTLRVVFCSAYSDYSWGEILREFGESPLLRELRKPFKSQEVRQLALSLVPA